MFTQNQIRQMFVANAYSTTAAEGNISVSKNGTDYKIVHYGKDGLPTIVHIPEDHIFYTKAVAAAKMKYTSRASLITLNSNYLIDHDNDSDTAKTLISGQDYILNVRINGLYWDSDEVWGHKYGAVHATYGMTPSDFYIKMALSLAKNLSRDAAPMLKVYVTTSTSSFIYSGSSQTVFEVTADTAESSLTGTYVGIVIDEVEQPWRLGVMPQHPVEFIANPSTIIFSGEEVVWGTSEKIAGNLTIQNSKKIADMEYFYHANRGDYNREAAWPNNWPAAYLANPSAQYGYDVVEIRWYWDGANHAVQKSEKDITIAFPATGASAGTSCDAFIDAWNNAGKVKLKNLNMGRWG